MIRCKRLSAMLFCLSVIRWVLLCFAFACSLVGFWGSMWFSPENYDWAGERWRSWCWAAFSLWFVVVIFQVELALVRVATNGWSCRDCR